MHGMVFTKIFRWLIWGLWGVTLCSCTTYRTLSIEIFQPAGFYIGQGKKLALLERNIRNENSILTFMKNIPALDREYLFEDFCEGVKFIWETSGYKDSIICLKEQEIGYWNQSSNPPPFAPDSIVNMCRDFRVDYLLSIELQYYDIVDPRGEINTIWLTRLYDKAQGEPVDSVKISFKLDQENFGEFDNLLEGIRNSFWEAGMISGQRLVPSWQETRRRVYTSGKVLRLGDTFLRHGDSEEAFNIWTGALKLAPKTAIQAGINLGWLYENAGDFEQARDILSECRKLAEENKLKGEEVNYLKDYLEIICRRMEEMKILDRQTLPAEP